MPFVGRSLLEAVERPFYVVASNLAGVTTDPPADARDTLTELLGEARERARRGETDEVEERLEAVETVAETELPDGPLKRRLLHGRSEAAVAAGDEPLVAAEYLRAMGELVAEANAGGDADGPDGSDGER